MDQGFHPLNPNALATTDEAVVLYRPITPTDSIACKAMILLMTPYAESSSNGSDGVGGIDGNIQSVCKTLTEYIVIL